MSFRAAVLTAFAAALFACGHRPDGNAQHDAGTDAALAPADACVGLACDIASCPGQGQLATTVSGTVSPTRSPP